MRISRTTTLVCALAAASGGAAPAGAEDAGEGAPRIEAAAPDAGLSAEAERFRTALRAETAELPTAERAAIEGFFAARDQAPFWTDGGSGRAEALVAALEAAPEHALPRRRHDPEALAEILGPASEAPAAMREVAATRSFLRLAGDLAGGVLTPIEVDPEIDVTPERPSPSALLARLAEAPVAEVLAGVEPADPDYRRLMAEKARLESLLRTRSWGPGVPEGPTLHVFESGPRIAALRERLARLGYDAPADDAEIAKVFDPGLERQVEAFQRDHGLIDDGVVGARTLVALNAPVETRLAQVVVNLERLRWMDPPAERRIVVNIPAYSATLFDQGEAVWVSRVVVGKPDVTETPEFSGVVRYMVVNPTWHIPDSIAVRDFLPKLQRDKSVLERQNIRLLTRGGTEINPKLVDFTQYTPENFPFRIKQRPSEDNALGDVKFMFPNEFSVYMHDTPHREYFARDERALSNGCIRLEKPVELAHILLAGQAPDPEAAYAGWRAAGREKRVDLERPIPVTITYRTVVFDATGTARYRADVYGRDAAVFRALEALGATLPAAQG